jgi:predicted lipoprotein with Yx(FWY)xxD motif
MTERWTRSIGLATLAVAATLALAACGDDDGDDASAATSSGDAVSTQTIDGTDVLVDADGRALYVADQEQGGEVLCEASCLEIWDPLLVSELDADAASLESAFADVKRPDGGRQMTFDGAPLYSFTEEGPGELTGDGVVDSFDGIEFTWRAATSGDSTSADSSESDSSESDSSGGGAYGGY